ncbi:MAG: 3-isopropylmalate dehydratase/homoaconitate hydratase family large subunit [Thermoplasmatales archaeon]|nr:3-isopropylmalate dehydratase/homoaconitate hydratase family large subunit [Thermoplasmatales archaeon]
MSTLSERILRGEAGSFVDVPVDRALSHDGTGVQALTAFREMGLSRIARPDRTSVVYDHIVPANNSVTADLQADLRRFAVSNGVHFCDIGEGICHQVMSEGVVIPGEVVVGADSHTCTMGAFGAFATGVGASDMASIWATGETWFKVPETINIRLEGKLPEYVEAKDIALRYVGLLGAGGATYKAIEFTGDNSLELDDRLTISNMSVESGAKAGLFYADDVTCRYLRGHGRDAVPQKAEDCSYVREETIRLDDLEPLLAVPHKVDDVRPVSDFEGTPLDQVFVGTCTNGRYGDLKRFADIVKGKKVRVRTVVVPASRAVLLRAIETGVLRDIVESGAVVGNPGCGPCLGAHQGVLGEDEIGLSTANRNFKNRMGVGAKYYLSSPTTAAFSALKGEIASPEDFP